MPRWGLYSLRFFPVLLMSVLKFPKDMSSGGRSWGQGGGILYSTPNIVNEFLFGKRSCGRGELQHFFPVKSQVDLLSAKNNCAVWSFTLFFKIRSCSRGVEGVFTNLILLISTVASRKSCGGHNHFATQHLVSRKKVDLPRTETSGKWPSGFVSSGG